MDFKTVAGIFGLKVDNEDALIAALGAERDKVAKSEALAKQVEDLKTSVAAKNEAFTTLTEEHTKVAEALAKAEETNKAHEASAREATVDAAIAAGTIAPAQKDWALEHFDAFESLRPTLEASKIGAPLGTITTPSGEKPDGKSDDRAALAAEARALSVEKKIPFTEALAIVRKERKE